jgi:hypothetical protein
MMKRQRGLVDLMETRRRETKRRMSSGRTVMGFVGGSLRH